MSLLVIGNAQELSGLVDEMTMTTTTEVSPAMTAEIDQVLTSAWQDIQHNAGFTFRDAVAKQLTKFRRSLNRFDTDDLIITDETVTKFLVELATSERCMSCCKSSSEVDIESGADNCNGCNE